MTELDCFVTNASRNDSCRAAGCRPYEAMTKTKGALDGMKYSSPVLRYAKGD